MFRVLTAILLFRLLAQTSGFDQLVATCPPDCNGVDIPVAAGPMPTWQSPACDCNAGCDDCPCCPHQRPATLQPEMQAVAPDALHLDFETRAYPVDPGPPHEIFHIPRRSFSV